LAESLRGSLRNGHPAKVFTSYRPPGLCGARAFEVALLAAPPRTTQPGRPRASFLPRCSWKKRGFSLPTRPVSPSICCCFRLVLRRISVRARFSVPSSNY